MTPGLLIWLSFSGVALTAFAATGAHVLNEFAKHDLEEYCERRGKKQLFGRILDLEDRMALGAETFRIIATTLTICAAVGMLAGNNRLAEYSLFQWSSLVALLSVCLLYTSPSPRD